MDGDDPGRRRVSRGREPRAWPGAWGERPRTQKPEGAAQGARPAWHGAGCRVVVSEDVATERDRATIGSVAAGLRPAIDPVSAELSGGRRGRERRGLFRTARARSRALRLRPRARAGASEGAPPEDGGSQGQATVRSREREFARVEESIALGTTVHREGQLSVPDVTDDEGHPPNRCSSPKIAPWPLPDVPQNLESL